MQALRQAVQRYAGRHGNGEGLALTPLPGLRMMCVADPGDALHAVYRPLVCFVLQGAKHMSVGEGERLVRAGQSVIVAADMPVVGRIVEATPAAPYLAIAVELEPALLREISVQAVPEAPPRGARSDPLPRGARPEALPRGARYETLFAEDSEAAMLDCALRLARLLDRPEAVPLLSGGILRELHYWLLSGPHGARLRAMADPGSHAGRLATAIGLLRDRYRDRVPVGELAAAAAMSQTAFHRHFKAMTSLTPGQYQKRLRLVEARRLMVDAGLSASNAAFEVGYESVSQFTREYGRLFGAPPKRDALRARAPAGQLSGAQV